MSQTLLQSLYEDENTSIARRVRCRLPEIEEALRGGFRHRKIHEQLVLEGIEMTFEYYLRLIPRLRREVEAANKAKRTTAATRTVVPDHPSSVTRVPGQRLSGLRLPIGEAARGHTAKDAHLSTGIVPAGSTLSSSITGQEPNPEGFTWDPERASKTDFSQF